MDVLSLAMKAARSALKAGGAVKASADNCTPDPGKFDKVSYPGSNKFSAGFAKRSILPPDAYKKPYFIAGYQENKKSIGVLDAPQTHALWLDDMSGHGGIVIVSIDDVGLLNEDVNEIRSRLKDFALISHCRSINVVSTHNHAGIDTMGIWGPLPFSGKDKGFMEILFTETVNAVKEAYETRKTGDLFLGRIHVPDMQEDIRLPVVYSDVLTRLRFVPDDGSNDIYFINFASHSESLQGCNKLISADFPCYLRRRIADKSGAETIYCVGCIGGMISMEIPNEQEIRDNGSDFSENTKAIGFKLADYALAIKPEDEIKLTPKISFMKKEFFFEADNTVLMLAAKIGLLSVKEHHVKGTRLNHALKSEMTYIEIDSLKIVLLPGELFPELAYGGYLTAEESGTGKGAEVNPTPLTEITGDKDTMFIGLANDEVGYILPPNDFVLHPDAPYADDARDRLGRRHYEETNSLGPNTAVKIAEILEEIIKSK